MKTVYRTYEFKLKNRKSYQNKFDKWIGICRLVYNLAKETRDFAYMSRQKSLTYNDLQNQLPELKKEFSFISEVRSSVLQNVVRRLDNSYKRFLKNPSEVGYPKFAKKNKYLSFEMPCTNSDVRFAENGIKLSSFGTVKVFNFRRIDGKIKSARVLKKVDGLYTQLVMEVLVPDTPTSDNQAVGIDLGVKYFISTSQGLQLKNPTFLFKFLREINILNRSVSRKKKGSNNRKKSLDKLRRKYLKVSRLRLDFHHKLSTNLARQYSDIYVEDLKVSEMMSDSKFAKYIQDCGWRSFIEILSNKTNVHKVDPKFTSQKCSNCGHIAKENRKTQSQFVCVKCAHTANADINAAHNILKAGVAARYSLT